MTKPAKETWEKLTSQANEDEQVRKMNESLDALDKELKKASAADEQEKGFRLPYSSLPKASNGRWK